MPQSSAESMVEMLNRVVEMRLSILRNQIGHAPAVRVWAEAPAQSFIVEFDDTAGPTGERWRQRISRLALEQNPGECDMAIDRAIENYRAHYRRVLDDVHVARPATDEDMQVWRDSYTDAWDSALRRYSQERAERQRREMENRLRGRIDDSNTSLEATQRSVGITSESLERMLEQLRQINNPAITRRTVAENIQSQSSVISRAELEARQREREEDDRVKSLWTHHDL